jgi:hypothetical protein
MTGRKPTRTTSAPAKGCKAPQARFCTDSASVNSDTEIAMSRVSEGMTSPKLWRTPIDRLSMTAAPIKIGATGRMLLMSAISTSTALRAQAIPRAV